MIALLTVALLQVADSAHVGLPASPVASIAVTPAHPIIVVGDSLRLKATPLDADGHPIPNASVRWFGGTRFEGKIDSTGMLRAGAPARFVVEMIAIVPGARPGKPTEVVAEFAPQPAARIEVTPAVHRLMVGQRLALHAEAYTALNDRRLGGVSWTSTDPHIVRVTADGRLIALAPGSATVSAASGNARTALALAVRSNTIRSVDITGVTGPIRTGDVVHFHAVAKDAAGHEIEGVTPEWTVAPGQGVIDPDGSFVPYEAGNYVVSAAVGGASGETGVVVQHRNIRRATTLVGRQPIAKFAVSEFWPHPNGKNAYLATIADRLYALDISDPSHPRITDSVIVDARVVNDVMTTPDGLYGVMTREGASSRRNGIVILSFADPAHPKQIAEYTETVTGGVHSTYIYQQQKFGTYVFLTDDATGSMRVIDLNDPMHPKEVARWETKRGAGRILHDIDIVDGLAYLSYWNDGLVILDVGNGMKGGSPTNPQFVSQYTYDLNDLYRSVEAEGGPGYIRGTHTAWRQRNGHYVFLGDEVFSFKPIGIGLPGSSLGKANGRLHVIDVSDIEHPREVGYYEPPDGGVHNVWVAGDTLYLGDYQGGLRVLDVSGELKGDLLAQDREIAHVYTGDAQGFVPNAAMTWGAFYLNGNVIANDIFSGLWIVKVEPKPQAPAIQ
jgi:hypothetical protein